MTKLLSILVGLAIIGVAGAQSVKVKIAEAPVTFDVEPQMVRGTTMVPLRSLANAMNGTLRYDSANSSVSVWVNGQRIDMMMNGREARVNDETRSMDEAPYIHRGRIFVPLKFMTEAAQYTLSSEGGWFVLRPRHR